MSQPRYAVMGDIHGNWDALSAVLRDAASEGVEQYVCVGDVVGYNAEPAACLDRIRDMDCVTVRGNHDHYCSHNESLDDFHPLAASVVSWTRRQLDATRIAFLRQLKLEHRVGGFTLVHSTLDMPERWGYVFDSLEAESHFNYQSTSLCFYGHTHVPVIFEKQSRVLRLDHTSIRLELGRKYFINVGSVGQPRDGDARASYVIYDSGSRECRFRRITYDVEAAQEKIRRAGLPERLAARLAQGK